MKITDIDKEIKKDYGQAKRIWRLSIQFYYTCRAFYFNISTQFEKKLKPYQGRSYHDDT